MNLNVSLHWFKADRLVPVRFYPYTSLVTNHIFWLHGHNGREIPKEIQSIFDAVKAAAIEKGAQWDNKVVIECMVEDFPHHVFMGYKDWALSLGFGVTSDSWIKPIEL